jgi:hypothetical protein
MDETKMCRDCGEVKPLSDFYPHKAMADGHLNKCKICVRDRVSRHREENIDQIKEYDRERGRTDKRRAKVTANAHKYKDRIPEYRRRWLEKNTEKRAAHIKVGNAIRDGKLTKQPCEVCSEIKVHAHHDDHSKPMEVRWLCHEHHMAIHRIEVNHESE